MNWLSIWLCFLLVFQLSPAFLAAQQPAAPPAGKLNILILEGGGGVNNIREHTAQAPAVRVEDDDKRALSGAIVVFTLPSQGPSGTFSKGDKILTATTDEHGQASARGLRPNSLSGQMDIRVSVSYQGRTASATITQFNMEIPSAKKGSGKLIAIIALVGAAAAGGAIAGLHKGGANSSSISTTAPSAPIGITPGTGTVGAPPQ